MIITISMIVFELDLEAVTKPPLSEYNKIYYKLNLELRFYLRYSFVKKLPFTKVYLSPFHNEVKRYNWGLILMEYF